MGAESNDVELGIAMKLGDDSFCFFRSDSFAVHSGINVKVCVDRFASLERIFAEGVKNSFRRDDTVFQISNADRIDMEGTEKLGTGNQTVSVGISFDHC